MGSFARLLAPALLALPCLGVYAGAAPKLSELSGGVSIAKPGRNTWLDAKDGQKLGTGDIVRTAQRGHATLVFDDGSRVKLGPTTVFTLEEASANSVAGRLGIGQLRALVTKMARRRFRVNTPTAVCSVRGTEFSVGVDTRGDTKVQMFEGALAVADTLGSEVLIRDRQSVTVTDQGLQSSAAPEKKQEAAQASPLKESMKRELALQMSKEEVQAVAAQEAKSAVYQQGKALIDVNGNRVRIEEYIVRPDPASFKLVVLNERTSRFDYFFYTGTFNRALPDDLSTALRQMPGCIGGPCQYYLTDIVTGRSNTVDNMLEVSGGGHQVDVNNNLFAGDAVDAAYDPATDRFVKLDLPNPGGLGNQPFYKTLFDTNSLSFNGVQHSAWSPTGAPNVTNTSQLTYNNLTNVQFACAPPNCTYNESGLEHQIVYAEDATGNVWEKYDSYIISNEGRVATTGDFGGQTSGTGYKQSLLDWNFQQIVTASEFGGRSIDLVVEPKIFIESGLIP